MYLSKLDIIGFKSFAQQAKLSFAPGITAVVGPNGCGKTNIVDAIRWVLGEQKTSVLRSDIMENVIFNGSRNRKPLGMAEVSMTFENSKKILPTEYSEVTVSRRLFRNGESQYLLNNTQCRLRDILDLFMDTGMGPDSYSVIELKMVESILNGKAEERRHLFEEAAGVTKYKLRRKEASRKLLTVQKDLERVQDLLQEVSKNVASLARQAQKTRRYNNLQGRLKEIELVLLSSKMNRLNLEIAEQTAEIEKLQTAKNSIAQQSTDTETQLLSLNEQRYTIETDFQSALANENFIASQIAEKKKEAAVATEKLSAVNKSLDRLSAALEETEIAKQNDIDNLKNASIKIDELKQAKIEITAEYEKLSAGRKKAFSEVQSLREISSSANEEILTFQNSSNSINSAIKRNETKRETLEARIERSTDEIDEINNKISDLDEGKEKLTEELSKLEDKFSALESALSSAQERKATLQQEIDNLRMTISDKRNSLSGKTASLEFLSGLLDTDESSKYLLRTNDWAPSGNEKPQLAESVGCDERFRIAIDAALGESAHYFIVDTREDAESAIDILKRKSMGKATFICREMVNETSSPAGLPVSSEIYGWASEIVRVDDKLRFVLRAILGKTAIVENATAAETALNSLGADTAITLSGEVFSRKGFVRGGAVSKKEGQIVGRKERISFLQSEIKDLNEEINSLEASYQQKRKEFDSIDINSLNKELRQIEQSRQQTEQKLSSIELNRRSLQNNVSLIEQNAARYSEELAEIDNENQNYESELEELEEKLFLAREEYRSHLGELHTAEQELENSEKIWRESELRAVKIDTEIKSIENEIQRLVQQQATLAKREENARKEITNNKLEVSDLQTRIEEYNNEILGQSEKLEQAKAKREYFAQELSSLKEQTEQYSALLRDLSKQHERQIEVIHEREMKNSERRSNLTSVIQKAFEQFETDLQCANIQTPDGFEPESAAAEASELRNKLASLGSVNFMALEEYDTQNQRLQFYENQVKDLVESEKTLQETIVEINQTAEKKFIDTFAIIQENFKKLFKTLFGQDAEGELRLCEGNPLEADIEVIAKPPGKRPHSIDMLSGGEKTLTAIAMLFGIYLVKPSPFCILDEVDAPLDDLNIDRFINLIREFSVNTQFIIVTHNKRTMASAATLYGITMQEEGVSRIVSVRMDDAIV